jgi:lipopolysaccharide transport system ATP-binding protein
MSSEVAIRASGLGKSYALYRRPEDRLKQFAWRGRRRFYEEFWALRGIDLAVGRGETVGVIGRNGSGKSTLLQLICGTLRPSAGRLQVAGRVAGLLELGAGFNPEFTGRENVQLSAAVLGLSRAEVASRFAAIAAFAGIGEFMDQPVRRYSSGMFARLAFAVCAHVDADVLVVDEILGVGDAAFQQRCMRFLHQFRRRGTLILVSHDGAAIAKLCDRALWLERGEIREFGPVKEVNRNYLAACSKDGAAESDEFRLGGRTAALPPLAPPEPVAEEVMPDIGFDYDPEAIWQEAGGAVVEAVAFHMWDGARLMVASGGEDVELRVSCRAERALARPVVAFHLRDRLGQVLFGEDTYGSAAPAPLQVAAGEPFSAAFRFHLPYLPSGDYAVEALVFDAAADGPVALCRLPDACFLSVQASHPSHGLANIAMRATTLVVEPGDGAAARALEASAAGAPGPPRRLPG